MLFLRRGAIYMLSSQDKIFRMAVASSFCRFFTCDSYPIAHKGFC